MKAEKERITKPRHNRDSLRLVEINNDMRLIETNGDMIEIVENTETKWRLIEIEIYWIMTIKQHSGGRDSLRLLKLFE